MGCLRQVFLVYCSAARYENLRVCPAVRFVTPAGKGDMGGPKAELNKMVGKKGPQEGDPNVSNVRVQFFLRGGFLHP